MTDHAATPLILSGLAPPSHARLTQITQAIPLECCAVATLPELLSRTRTGYGVVLVDLVFDGQNALDLVARLSASREAYGVIVWSQGIDIPTALQAVKVGAVDVLLADCAQMDLLNSLLDAVERSRGEWEQWERERHLRLAVGQLSERELDVLAWLLEGASLKQIAATLQVSPRTVESAKKRVLESCQCQSVVTLARQVGASRSLRSTLSLRTAVEGEHSSDSRPL